MCGNDAMVLEMMLKVLMMMMMVVVEEVKMTMVEKILWENDDEWGIREW